MRYGISICFLLAGCWPATEVIRVDDIKSLPTENLECDIFSQDCPTGEKCAVWSKGDDFWNATRCVPITDMPDSDGELCTAEISESGKRLGPDSCLTGSGCWAYFEENQQGLCVPMCQGSQAEKTCADPQRICIRRDLSYGLVNWCVRPCHPLVTSQCGSHEVCAPIYNEELQEIFVCLPQVNEPQDYGELCDHVTACSKAQACVSAWNVPSSGEPLTTREGACTAFCDRNEENTCPDADRGQICLPWYRVEDVPPGFETLGICGKNL